MGCGGWTLKIPTSRLHKTPCGASEMVHTREPYANRVERRGRGGLENGLQCMSTRLRVNHPTSHYLRSVVPPRGSCQLFGQGDPNYSDSP